MSQEDAATRLKCNVNDLRKIESGEMVPLAGLFRRMSDLYLLPEATLLGLAEPPQDRPLPKDFRTFEGVPVSLSYETVAAIRRAESRQEALAQLALLDEDVVAPIIPLRSLKDDADKLGADFRKQIDFPIIDQMRAKAEAAFLRWRLLIEKLRISVYVEPLGEEDKARGISLFFNDFPAIVIDTNEKLAGARSFTLFHEYAHLLLRQTGVSDFNPANRVEAFCNRFAGAVLMPVEAIEAALKGALGSGKEPSLQALEDAARQLCVTIRQVAMRLEHLHFVEKGYYAKMTARLSKPAKKKTGGNEDTFKYAYLSKHGHYLPDIVFNAADKGILSAVIAGRVLNLSPSYFKPIRSIIDKRYAGELVEE